MTRSRFPLALALLAVVSCAGSTTTQRPSPETTRDNEEETYSSKTTIFGSREEADLDLARGYRRDGKYRDADTAYRALVDDSSIKLEVREQALFELAGLLSSPLNPRRDDGAAIKFLELFLEQYPKSEEAPRAQEQLTILRAQLGR